ncbi:sulfatase-like hydrolase/transferase [Tichowtungia aerotolerans]|uniref:Sulfatase-like hydrolase/transferase n=1 Tax=Tichowtungia aerotolerans TaxID=2697043 RepID=A0A6P1M8P2_9BACT|nr:sulfatase-like hydrolase/transferase [Tichowtungia aerotolerans]QHI68488.1 sulfatase-like hydrolase/transferase [Tichowtungia aerotolerans]
MVKTALVAGTIMAASLVAVARTPNVVIIFTDDQGYADLSCQGSKEMKTPNIDSIARNGIRFTNGYSSAPQCGPSRAGILTGQYQQKFAMEQNAGTFTSFGLPTNIKLFPQYMKEAGYTTAALGKWHIGGKLKEYFPENRGFDFVWCTPETPFVLNGKEYDGRRFTKTSTHQTDIITIGACDFIEKNKDKPFFMYVAYHVPHSPYKSVPKWLDQNRDVQDKDRRILAGMISELDDGVGRILSTLRENGLEEDTLIFYASDNGAPEQKYPPAKTSNGVLRGQKGNLYEGGVRVPWLVQWKGTIPGGQVLDDPVITLDILPTSLAAAGRTDLIAAEVDGVNLLPFFKGEAPLAERPMFFRWDGWLGMRQGRWKLVYPIASRKTAPPPYDSGTLELYDMDADIAEQKNLAQSYPEVLQKMEKQMLEWNQTLTAPGWISEDRKAQLRKVYGEVGMTPYSAPGYTGRLPGEIPWKTKVGSEKKTKTPDSAPKKESAKNGRQRSVSARDKDGDGIVTLEEFIAGRVDKTAILTEQFKKWDKDGDGQLQPAEQRRHLK